MEVCTVRKQHLPFPKIKTSIYVIQTVVLEKTLESPLDIKEINLEYSLEGLILKLKL